MFTVTFSIRSPKAHHELSISATIHGLCYHAGIKIPLSGTYVLAWITESNRENPCGRMT
jgi:hypothetical protein